MLTSAESAAAGQLSSLTSVRRLVVAGYAVIAVFLASFVGWAGYMPLSSAAIAKGTVGVEGRKKTIQHLDGGIVDRIEVQDGDVVNAGDLLVALDVDEAQSAYRELDNQVIQLEAELARWQAERRDLASPSFPEWLLTHERKTRAVGAMQTQQAILDARDAAYQMARESLAHELQLVEEEARAVTRRIANLEAKGALIDQELEEQKELGRQGLVTRADIFALRSEQADVRLEMDDGQSMRVQLKQRRAQLASQAEQLFQDRRQMSTEEATRVGNELSVLRQQLETASVKLSRLTIRSPIDGFVVNSQVSTVGGVIIAGEPLMDIMPRNERLLVESRVDPKDRDSVVPGQSAEVRFTALDRRSSFPVPGTVQVIAADSSTDPLTQQPFFRTIVELDKSLSTHRTDISIHPGMEAEVIILTGEQTLLDYLVSPVARSFNRALREE